MGRSLSRRKKLPLGPVKLSSSPTRARSARYSDITPPGVCLTRKLSGSSFGPLLKEYDRLSSVPGTATLTYCPGRNVSWSRFGISTVRDVVVGDSRSSTVIRPAYVAAWVLATAEELAICRTRSDFGVMLQGRQ